MTFCNSTDAVLPEAQLQEDYQNAAVFWKVRLGQQCLYYPRLLKTAYVPLSAITRAFIRVESVVSRVCCGPAEFNIYRLILCRDDAEIAAIELDSEVKSDRILAAIAKLGIPTGKPESAAS